MISVVIPTRHRNVSLAECLRRLAPGAQTLSADKYEVVVTDDGCTTTAEAMIIKDFPWARWTAGPKRGPAANRNRGISQTRGHWIVLVDDDCLPSTGWLAAYAASMVTAGPVDLLEGRTTCEAGLPSIRYEAPINLVGGQLFTCNLALPRTVLQRFGGFDERFPHASQEDIEFRERVRRHGCSFRFVRDAVVDHPPRPRLLGMNAGRRWEGRVLIDVLLGHAPPEPLAWHVLKVRHGDLRAAKFGLDWVRMAWSSAVEAAFVATHTRQWSHRYCGARPIDTDQKTLIKEATMDRPAMVPTS